MTRAMLSTYTIFVKDQPMQRARRPPSTIGRPVPGPFMRMRSGRNAKTTRMECHRACSVVGMELWKLWPTSLLRGIILMAKEVGGDVFVDDSNDLALWELMVSVSATM